MPAGGARRGGSTAATVSLVVVSLFCSLAALSFEANALGASGAGSVWVGVGMLAAFGVSAMVIVRDRYPVALTVVASVFALLFPADAFAALVGLSDRKSNV